LENSSKLKGEIHQLAFYEIHAQAIDKVKAAIDRFVVNFQANEPCTLRYDVWQEQKHPTKFVHIFVFRNLAAHEVHSSSAQVKEFADTLYSERLAPVEIVDFQPVAAKSSL
jgi:quinol monooxygenase YgiN